ncbi:TetR family transcriptional regulator [Streptomyces sp. NPDC059740]|uniref:TetR family transcriptional regulator n=1 Tax=Streptomyces sp. NPDC059740 TaxID=3346926 RepID=UPI0036546361
MRARRKQRTRNALIRSALELFTDRGYEHTTVDDIAAAVDVSQRTFFRYFANKEDVAFAVQDMVERQYVQALTERPADEPPLEALRNAVLASWEDIGSTIRSVVPLELHMRTVQVIESTPALVAAHLRRAAVLEEEIAGLIATRQGVDLDADPRPRVVVSAFGGVMRVAGRLWGEAGDCSVESIRRITAHHLDQIRPALEGDWRPRG